MKFDFDGRCYKNDIRYKTGRISAILDTGATITALDIYSLAMLSGFSGQDIHSVAMTWINSGRRTNHINTASGNMDRAVTIALRNVRIDDELLPKFYMRLNVDNDLWRSNGIVTLSKKEYQISPSLLLGLDFIRSCKITGDEDCFQLTDFDYEKYGDRCLQKYQDVLNIFSQLEGSADR